MGFTEFFLIMLYIIWVIDSYKDYDNFNRLEARISALENKVKNLGYDIDDMSRKR